MKRIFVDSSCYVDVLYYDTFERLQLDPEHLQPFKGSLIWLPSEKILVQGYISIKIIFRVRNNLKNRKSQVPQNSALSSYSIIIGHLTLKILG